MSILLPFKLLLTPLLIGLVTRVGRRWGPAASGWLMGFPLTSGPVSILLALQYGQAFAGKAAVGTLGGMASSCVFSLVYYLVSRSFGWQTSATAGLLGFFLSIYCWNQLSLALLPTFILSIVVIVLILMALPNKTAEIRPNITPRWDMPARMAAAALFVLILTTAANALGPKVSGMLSPFPIFTTVIAAFTHHQQGSQVSTLMLRGLVLGSFAFNSFFLVVGYMLPVSSLVVAYGLATLAALAVNSLALRFLRPRQPILPEG